MREYINLAEIRLFPEMNEKIVELLMIRNDDIVSMYAAKLIRKYQAERANIDMRMEGVKDGV